MLTALSARRVDVWLVAGCLVACVNVSQPTSIAFNARNSLQHSAGVECFVVLLKLLLLLLLLLLVDGISLLIDAH